MIQFCFTDSPLQIALLALFCEMLYRFSNLAVANLTRDSVRAALMRGITAEQVRFHNCTILLCCTIIITLLSVCVVLSS